MVTDFPWYQNGKGVGFPITTYDILTFPLTPTYGSSPIDGIDAWYIHSVRYAVCEWRYIGVVKLTTLSGTQTTPVQRRTIEQIWVNNRWYSRAQCSTLPAKCFRVNWMYPNLDNQSTANFPNCIQDSHYGDLNRTQPTLSPEHCRILLRTRTKNS
jgi:hypothetical protein